MKEEKIWVNKGPDIDGDTYLVSPVNDKDDLIAIVMHEEDTDLIVHAPEMYRIVHELVGLNLLRERIGETDVIKQGFRKFHNGVPCDIATTCHYLTDR